MNCMDCGAPENAYHKDECKRSRFFEAALTTPPRRMVHNHDYDPSCWERMIDGKLVGNCLRLGDPAPSSSGSTMAAPPAPDFFARAEKTAPFEKNLEDILVEINEMMVGRHEKYGPGNIAEFGDLGILVRMSDKFARLKNGRENFNDETIRDTLMDVCGYSLIWLLWLDKKWPGTGDGK